MKTMDRLNSSTEGTRKSWCPGRQSSRNDPGRATERKWTEKEQTVLGAQKGDAKEGGAEKVSEEAVPGNVSCIADGRVKRYSLSGKQFSFVVKN